MRTGSRETRRRCFGRCVRWGLGIACGLGFLSGTSLAGESPGLTNHSLPHGFSYYHDDIAEGPWSIHIVKVDRSNPDLELHTAVANGNRFGLTTLSEQMKTLPKDLGRPIAAINGDYYCNNGPYTGDPKGLQILRGELLSGPCDWTCFWVDEAGNPQMSNVVSHFVVTWPGGETIAFGLNEERKRDAAVLYTTAVGSSTHAAGGLELILERNGTEAWLPLQAGQIYSARVRDVRRQGDTPLSSDTMVLSLGPQMLNRVPVVLPGAVLKVSTVTSPSLKGVKTAIGGGPAVLRNGIMVTQNQANVRHPRTAIGWNQDYFFLVEVDGRQLNLSIGMTYPELSNYLLKLGCREAMSLDGGGSATCWVYGQVMNNPSEGRERGTANALVLIDKKKK